MKSLAVLLSLFFFALPVSATTLVYRGDPSSYFLIRNYVDGDKVSQDQYFADSLLFRFNDVTGTIDVSGKFSFEDSVLLFDAHRDAGDDSFLVSDGNVVKVFGPLDGTFTFNGEKTTAFNYFYPQILILSDSLQFVAAYVGGAVGAVSFSDDDFYSSLHRVNNPEPASGMLLLAGVVFIFRRTRV